MAGIIINWLLAGLALFIVSRIIPGIHVDDFGSALVAVIIIGLVNALVKPLLLVLTLPITVVTMGLFLFVLNALMLVLAGVLTPGFRVDGFGTALIGSILLSVITTLLQFLIQ